MHSMEETAWTGSGCRPKTLLLKMSPLTSAALLLRWTLRCVVMWSSAWGKPSIQLKESLSGLMNTTLFQLGVPPWVYVPRVYVCVCERKEKGREKLLHIYHRKQSSLGLVVMTWNSSCRKSPVFSQIEPLKGDMGHTFLSTAPLLCNLWRWAH